MENVADLILKQEDIVKKAELVYYLQKKTGIFFDKSVILKAEIAKLFIEKAEIKDVNKNMVLTASLLYACKKINGAQTMQKIHEYAKESVIFLEQLGFNEKFCNICQMHNRYLNIEPRNMEGDILELSEQLGGMILDRIDRQGYQIPEAIQIIKKNLKEKKNSCLDLFENFVLSTENLSRENETRPLNEKDKGLIGSSEYGLRRINKFDNNDIRGTLLYIQEWEIRNGLRKEEVPEEITKMDEMIEKLKKEK